MTTLSRISLNKADLEALATAVRTFNGAGFTVEPLTDDDPLWLALVVHTDNCGQCSGYTTCPDGQPMLAAIEAVMEGPVESAVAA